MSKHTILVVDDNELIRFTCRLALERAGFNVVVAEDGVAALALAQRHLPSLVLLDLSMPVLNGWQTARGLSLDARTAGIPIVAHTAEPDVDTRRLREVGFTAHLDKMAGTHRVVEVVQRLLDRVDVAAGWVELPQPDQAARFA